MSVYQALISYKLVAFIYLIRYSNDNIEEYLYDIPQSQVMNTEYRVKIRYIHLKLSTWR